MRIKVFLFNVCFCLLPLFVLAQDSLATDTTLQTADTTQVEKADVVIPDSTITQVEKVDTVISDSTITQVEKVDATATDSATNETTTQVVPANVDSIKKAPTPPAANTLKYTPIPPPKKQQPPLKGTTPLKAIDVQLTQRGAQPILEVIALDQQGNRNSQIAGLYTFQINEDKKVPLNFINGKAVKALEKLPKTLYVKAQNGQADVFYRLHTSPEETQQSEIPLWLSIIPPLITILLALLFREVLLALFLGIWSGIFILNGFTSQSLFWSFFAVIDTYILNALKNPDHLAIIVFSSLIGGMVAIISRNGGMAGVVNGLSKLARGPRSSQLVTWFMGLAIFFDDYANTLVVGNTMRSLTDKYRVSREKLAYIVDSTAAPVAAIALITTWIGAELGYIGDAAKELGLAQGPYSIFLHSLQYAYYPIFTLVFILLLVLLKRDFGPMLKAERRARTTGKLSENAIEQEGTEDLDEFAPLSGVKQRAYNGILPVLTVIIATLAALVFTGVDSLQSQGRDILNEDNLTWFSKVSEIIGSANSYLALIWSSLLGVVVAIFLSVAGRFLSLRATMESLLVGVKAMMGAIVILTLAWALAQITKDLHTADFLTTLLQGSFDPRLLPIITFLLAGLTAFSTGSSWGTMAILYPLILPATWVIASSAGFSDAATMPIFYNVVSSVLAGAVFGDHCSPISDTTILSSLACQANHIDHVRTQLPYAITVAIVSVGMSGVAMFYGEQVPIWAIYLIGVGILFLLALILGRYVKDAEIPNADDTAEISGESTDDPRIIITD